MEAIGKLQNEVSEITSRSHAEVKSLRNKTGVIEGQVGGLWEKASIAESEIHGLRDKTRSTEKELSGIWEAGSRYNREFRELWRRIEFVRREILFEFRYSTQTNRGAAVTPRILNPARLEAAQQTSCLRVNLGCGHIALPDFVNVDQRELPGVDIVAEIGNLPFTKDSLDEIASAHLLEHFPQEELQRRLLPYWFSLLKPGSVFRAVVPDGDAMVTMLAGGNYSFEDFRSVLFGGQDYDGDFHYNLFTPNSLSRLLEQAGFTEVEIPVKGRANGQCFEFEIQARRPVLSGIEATVHDG
ncbi:MAG: class I SAM-dependent methyltransferase [Candidatus Acidiferrales bacterium]